MGRKKPIQFLGLFISTHGTPNCIMYIPPINSSQPVLLTIIIILFSYLNKNAKENKNIYMFSNFVKATTNYSKMPFIFRF